MFESYQKVLAEHLQSTPDRIHLYWKGRVALFALLKSMDLKPGDEVILPAFTCVVVPNAILYAGARPVYVDIDRVSLNTNLERIKAARTDSTRVVICQNTFGLSSEVDEIASWAREEGIYSIEDCTHGFGGMFKGRPNGSYCDAAFYSTQWNKPFSTGIGGFSLVKSESLNERILETNQYLQKPALGERLMLSMQIWARKNLLNKRTYWTLLKIYRWLSKNNIILGSSSGGEIEGTLMPSGYFKMMSQVQSREGIRAIKSLARLLKVRRENAQKYSDELISMGKYHVDPSLNPHHSFLKYPILVKDRPAFLAAAEQNSIELGDWFLSPLHPVKADCSPWGLDIDQFPTAKSCASSIVNLPTDTQDPAKVIRFLRKYQEQLI